MRGIQEHASARGITRLCHFTPSRNLAHILVGREGIQPSRHLQDDIRCVYNPTDLDRLDGHTEHVCCSVQFPNAWYLQKAREREILFPDWVVVLLRPHLLWSRDTLFSPRNAAASYGGLLRAGAEGFAEMFPTSVTGAWGKTFNRGPRHLANAPTDDQAEVLVPGRIPIEDVIGIAVASEAQANDEAVRLELCGFVVPDDLFVISPVLFDKRALSVAIRVGAVPDEASWVRSGPKA